jgi:GTP cyclohydrolase II
MILKSKLHNSCKFRKKKRNNKTVKKVTNLKVHNQQKKHHIAPQLLVYLIGRINLLLIRELIIGT